MLLVSLVLLRIFSYSFFGNVFAYVVVAAVHDACAVVDAACASIANGATAVVVVFAVSKSSVVVSFMACYCCS
jgi:acetyl-CoA acetyltransferase